jgi:hydrogenase maturation factor
LLIALAANEAEQALSDLKAAGLQEVARIGQVVESSKGVIELR